MRRLLFRSDLLVALAVLGAVIASVASSPSHADRGPAIRSECIDRIPALAAPETRAELFFALARGGDAEALETLAMCGVEPDVRNGAGRTALHLAAYHGHDASVRVLLVHHAIADAADIGGLTPLMNASFRGHDTIVRALLDAGAEVDRENAVGQTAAMFAALFGRERTLALLASRGADLDRRDRLGSSARALRAASRPAEAAERFLRAGVREARALGSRALGTGVR